MGSSRLGFTALVLVAGLTGRAFAQDPRGGELRINRATAGIQSGVSVAVAANGDFVAVWLSGPNPGPRGIMARLFTADGRAKGGDVLVARVLHSPRVAPRVAADTAGRFTIVWTAPNEPSSGAGKVFGRRFGPAGRPLGNRFRISPSERRQLNPDIAMTPEGRAVIVWEELTGRFDPEGVEIAETYIRRVDALGTFAGPPALGVGLGELPRVAIRPDGAFVVASQIYGFEASFYDVYVSLFGADGAPVRETFQVNGGDNVSTSQFDPAIAVAADGRMFVSWTDQGNDAFQPGSGSEDIRGVAGQLLAADGGALGDSLRVNTFWRGNQESSVVVATPGGGFLVAWETGGNQDGDGTGIFARQFAADGRRLGSEFRLNLGRQGNQSLPALALTTNGRGVAAWAGPDGDGSGLFARRLGPPVR